VGGGGVKWRLGGSQEERVKGGGSGRGEALFKYQHSPRAGEGWAVGMRSMRLMRCDAMRCDAM